MTGHAGAANGTGHANGRDGNERDGNGLDGNGGFCNGRFAVIFDWDGVVVDSADPHEESWQRLAAEVGARMPDDHFQRGFGMKNETIIPELFGWTRDPDEIQRLSARKETLYREIILEQGIELLPGASALLDALQRENVPVAVGSSTHRLNITTVLDRLQLRDRFRTVVSAEDVSYGKPHPEVFLVAAQRLNTLPSRCVVIEDAPAGLQAARAAGMVSLAVTTTHEPSALQAADRVVLSLEDISVVELRGMVRGQTPAF